MRISDLLIYSLKQNVRTGEPPLQYLKQHSFLAISGQIDLIRHTVYFKIVQVLKQDRFSAETNLTCQHQETNMEIVGPSDLGWGMWVAELENPEHLDTLKSFVLYGYN